MFLSPSRSLVNTVKNSLSVPAVRLLELRNTYKWGGGPDKTILLSAEQHDPNKVDVIVVYIRDVNDREFQITERARAKGLTFYEIVENGKFDLRVLFQLRHIIQTHDINIIHAHDVKSDLFAYLVKWTLPGRRVSLISTAHGWAAPGPRGDFYRALDLFIMKRFDRLIAVSNATKQLMINSGVPERIIEVIYNGIDTTSWVSKGVNHRLRDDLGIPKSCPVIGYVGRITPEKDLDTWIHIAAKVEAKSPSVRFMIVGEGKDNTLTERLRKKIKELGLEEKVHFVGFHQVLQPYYGAMDVLLLTSDREGLPNCILEAMAMSLPVVTTGVGGVPEIVVADQTGFVGQVADVEGLSASVSELVQNLELRSKMAQAGRRRIEEIFSFRKRLELVECLYEGMVEASG